MLAFSALGVIDLISGIFDFQLVKPVLAVLDRPANHVEVCLHLFSLGGQDFNAVFQGFYVQDAPWMMEKLMITASEYEVAVVKFRNVIKAEPAAK